MNIKDLAQKIESLEGQSSAVNLDIMKFMGFADDKDVLDGDRFSPKGSRHSHLITNYTGSIDAALHLIPKGWGMIGLEKCGNEWACELALGGEQLAEHRYTDRHKVASIAILTTIFKLKQYLVEE